MSKKELLVILEIIVPLIKNDKETCLALIAEARKQDVEKYANLINILEFIRLS